MSPFEVRERHSVAVPFVKLSPLVRVIQTVNDNLEQQAQAIYHERFETVSPNDLPSDWRIVTLGEVATISNKSFNPLKEPEILLEHYSIPAFDEARFPVFELSTSIKSNKFIIDASCFGVDEVTHVHDLKTQPNNEACLEAVLSDRECSMLYGVHRL